MYPRKAKKKDTLVFSCRQTTMGSRAVMPFQAGLNVGSVYVFTPNRRRSSTYERHEGHSPGPFSVAAPSQNLISASAILDLHRVKSFASSGNASGNAGGIGRGILEERGAEASAEELARCQLRLMVYSRTTFD